jgi:hypothetical protein
MLTEALQQDGAGGAPGTPILETETSRLDTKI